MAIRPVIIAFEAQKVAEVRNALKSIADAVAQTSRSSARAARSGVNTQEQAYRQLVGKTHQWQREQTRGAEAAARAEARATERAAREKAKASAAVARQQEREFARVAKDAGKWQREQVRDAERAAKAEQKASERAAKEEIRAAERASKEKAAAIERANRESEKASKEAIRRAEREADREKTIAERAAREKIQIMRRLDAEARRAGEKAIRDFERDEKKKERKADKWRKDREREETKRRGEYADSIMGGGRKAAQHMYRGGAALTRTALNLGGGFDVQTALQEKLDLERAAIQFSNSAFQNRPGEKRLDAGAIQETTKQTAIRTGTDAADLMAGSAAYGAKSGNYTEGLKLQEFFGKVSKGTDATVQDVAKTAGILRVQNKDLTTDQMKQLLLNTIRSGQRGSVEFSDLARVAGKVTRTSASYEGDQGKTQGKLLGLAQIAMRTSGSPEEAATVLSNISADAMKHSDNVTAVLGAKTFNAKGQIAQAPEEFLADIMAKTGGNLQKIQGMGFGMRSMKMFQALAPTFNEAERVALEKSPKDKAGARNAGREAVLADMKEMTDASMTTGELESNVAEIMKSGAEQFEASVRELKMMVSQELMPVFKDMIPIIRDALPTLRRFLEAFAKIAQWAERNPLAASLAVLGGSIVKEVMGQIISAKIGNLIKRLLSGAGVPAGAPPVPPGTGKLGTIGKGLAVVGAGIVAAELTKEWVDEGFAAESGKQTDRTGAVLEATNVMSDAARGPLTGEQREKAMALKKQLETDLAAQRDEMDPEKRSLVKQVTGAFGAVVGGKDFEEAQQVEQREQERTYKQTTEALAKVIEALDRNTAATKENSKQPGTPGGGDKPPAPGPYTGGKPIATR